MDGRVDFSKISVSWLNQYGYLSTILIPLTLILYVSVPPLRPVLFKHMIAIGLIGIIEVGYFYEGYKKKHSTWWTQGLQPASYIFSVILHVLLLLVLINFAQYWNFNKFSFVLLIIVNLIIIFLPWWPYFMSKTTLLVLYNVIYLAILGIGSLIYK